MLVKEQKISVKWNGRNRKHYETIYNKSGQQKYIFSKNKDEFKVDLEDLQKSSRELIKVRCDYCGKVHLRPYYSYNNSLKNRKVNKDFCPECKSVGTSAGLMKYSYEFMVEKFKESNKVPLIAKEEYRTSATLVEYRCTVCDHKSRVSLSNLLLGVGCEKCSFEIRAVKQRLDYEFIKSEFQKNGLTLITKEYKNKEQKLDYICHCGNQATTTYGTVRNGLIGCKKCRYKAISESSLRYTIKDAKEIFEKEGYILIDQDLDKKISTNNDRLKYKCPKGHEHDMILAKFMAHRRCPTCNNENQRERYQHDYEYVKNIFKEKGAELLSEEYVNMNTKIKYKCQCGHISETTLGNYSKIKGCPNCAEKSKGEALIKSYLINNNIIFKMQFCFNDCKNKKALPFDFALLSNNGELLCLIEYDGEQHFTPVDFAGKGEEWAREQFEVNKIKDQIKNNYCRDNDIKLIRIPYWEYSNIENILKHYLIELIENFNGSFLI